MSEKLEQKLVCRLEPITRNSDRELLDPLIGKVTYVEEVGSTWYGMLERIGARFLCFREVIIPDDSLDYSAMKQFARNYQEAVKNNNAESWNLTRISVLYKNKREISTLIEL